MSAPKPSSHHHHHRKDAVTKVATAVVTVSDTRTRETDTGGKTVTKSSIATPAECHD